MGEVYRARNSKLHRDIAIKVPQPRWQTTPTMWLDSNWPITRPTAPLPPLLSAWLYSCPPPSPG